VSEERPPVEIELETLIRARYPLVYIVSWEERRVEETLREICQRRGKTMVLWTFTTGMAGNVASRDPLAALDYVLNAPDQHVFVLKDFHPFISDAAVTRRLRDLIYMLKSSFKHLIILSPILKLPPELEKEITVVDYKLPTVAELDRLLEGVIQAVKDDPRLATNLSPQEREQVLQAASGLTSIEAENVFAKSLVEKKTFDIDVILGEKEQIIRKSGILEYYRQNEAFADVGGLDLLKEWLRQRTASFSKEARDYGLPEPRGMLLLGVQGSGKSLTAKAIASLWKLPLLRLDIGKVFSGIVGSSEENMRRAIATAESVAPCVSGDTRITLADGSEVPIATLYNNPPEHLSVLGMDEQWQIRPVNVRAVTRRPAPDLFRVRLQHGELEATSNHLHPVLRNGKLHWVRTDNLQTDDCVAVPNRLPIQEADFKTVAFLPEETRLYAPNTLQFAWQEVVTSQRRFRAKKGREYVKIGELQNRLVYPKWNHIERFVLGRGGTTDSKLCKLPETISSDLGYLLGLIESDGFIGKRNRIGFVNTEKFLHCRFATLLEQLFGLIAQTRIAETGKSSPQLSGTNADSQFRPCHVTYADSRLLALFLRELRKHLLTLPPSVLIAFVRGYFDGDGCISNPVDADPKVTLTAKRKEQNRLLRSVLQRIGFLTTNPHSANIEVTGYYNVIKFIAEIGSEHPCRREKMEDWLQATPPAQAKSRTDTIPVGELLRQLRRELGVSSNKLALTSSSLLHRYETGEAHPNRHRLRSILSELEAEAMTQGTMPQSLHQLCLLAEAPITWSPVKTVETLPTPEYVYDLVCDSPHTFIANGIVTHNCILWIDELEKGLSGTQSSGSTDGGTTSRVFSTFLTWLSEKKAACFVVATSNDVTQLPPELMRKGRFDEIFFVDLPAYEERKEIFAIHLKKRKRDPAKFDLGILGRESAGYSGAEIEQAVIGSLFSAFHDGMRELTTEDLVKTIRESVPLSVTMQEGIERLREWAETRARQASSMQSESTEELAQLDSARKLEALALLQSPLTGPLPSIADVVNPSPYVIEVEEDEEEATEAEKPKTASRSRRKKPAAKATNEATDGTTDDSDDDKDDDKD
jgi:ATP-dependent 26S proteasome regulatory subunit